MNTFLLQITLIAVVGFAAQWSAWRLKVPAIVFLLVSGFVFGPLLGIIQPQALLGDLMRPAVSVAVSIILFEASINLKFRELKEFGTSVRHIVLIGGSLSWIMTALAAHYVAGLSWPVAVTFGGLLIVTGPTVIMPLLRSARLNTRIATVLKWEGIINDPLGVLYAVLAYEYFEYRQAHDAMHVTFYLHFAGILALVGVANIGLGFLVTRILERGHVPEYLKSYFLFILVIADFCLCNAAMDEAGLLAVTVLGMTVGNRNVTSLAEIRKFKETVTLLLVSGVFLLLTASLDPKVLLDINLRGLAFIALLLLVIRPVAMLIAGLGTTMKRHEILMIGWVAPRGVVCAAIAGVMGPQLVAAGFADGDKLLPLAFAIVIITVLVQSLSVKPLGVRMGLSVNEAGGIIIAGAVPWSVQLASLLKDRDVPILLADPEYRSLKEARLANLPVFYGEVLSEDAEFKIDHTAYGGMLAATPNSAYNALVCTSFAGDFGQDRVWQAGTADEKMSVHKQLAHERSGRLFAEPGLGHDSLTKRYAAGERFRASKIGGVDNHADEASILASVPHAVKVGLLRAGHVMFRSPAFDPAGKEGDVLLWFGQPRAEAAAPKA